MIDGASSVMFTAAFGIAKQLVPAIAKKRNLLRFILSGKSRRPRRCRRNSSQIASTSSCPMGYRSGSSTEFKNGKPVARKPIAEFELDKWFLEEEHLMMSAT